LTYSKNEFIKSIQPSLTSASKSTIDSLEANLDQLKTRLHNDIITCHSVSKEQLTERLETNWAPQLLRCLNATQIRAMLIKVLARDEAKRILDRIKYKLNTEASKSGLALNRSFTVRTDTGDYVTDRVAAHTAPEINSYCLKTAAAGRIHNSSSRHVVALIQTELTKPSAQLQLEYYSRCSTVPSTGVLRP
jgi:hypothetical protein